MPDSALSILIIDDEKPIRDEIKSMDWAAVNAFIIDEAVNGQDGLIKCKQLHPDIVLADIEMPLMNGLQFAEQLKQTASHIQIIFLTSHQNFSYAQKGIELGILGYVVKSLCMEKDLFPYISKAADNLKKEARYAIQEKNNQKENIKHITYELMEGKTENREALEKLLSFPCKILLLTHTHREFAEQVSVFLQHYLNNIQDVTAVYLSSGKYILFIPAEIAVPAAVSCKNLNQLIREKTMLPISGDIHFYANECSLVSSVKTYIKVVQSFDQLDLYYFYFGTSMLQNASSQNYGIDVKDFLKQFSEQINNGTYNPDTLNFLKKNCYDHQVPPADLKHFLLSNLYKTIPERFSGDTDYSSILYSSETFDQLLNSYYDITSKTSFLKDMRTEVANAIRYIEQNYMNSITLCDVADVVSISPNYLSKLFKNELGESFNNYLNTVRIHKAIDLLENTNKKVYEVAQCVGIESYRYFLVIFKKISGKSPTEYQHK